MRRHFAFQFPVLSLVYLALSPALLAAISLSPATATVSENGTQQLTASAPATWKTTCGNISTTGLFHAPLYAGKCTVTATSTSDATTAATAITVTSPIVMTPGTARTPQGNTQQFSANMPVIWSASCGTITTGGLFTASSAPNTYCTVEAISSGSPKYTVYGWDQSVAGTGFSIAPASPQVSVGKTLQFTASSAATWTASCGTISSTGLYTAPATIGSCTITGKSSSGLMASSAASIVFTIAPINPHLVTGGTQQFTSSSAATWTATCGMINAASGLYSAPAASNSCSITANTGGGATASTTATIAAAGAVTPDSAELHALGTQQFSINVAATWSASCGAISSTGLFTAPAAEATCTITATPTGGTGASQATATVSVANYTSWKNSVGGVGQERDEFQLTPANVSGGHFSQLWSAAVDAGVWGQPLYLNAIPVGGKTRNVVFAATSNDSVYAFDGDTGVQLWKKSFLSTGVTAVAGVTAGISTQTGVLSTMTINPATGTLYVVAETAENSNTSFPHRLHALDVTTGNEKAGSPVLISDPALPPLHKFQRPSLLLANDRVYVGFGSIEDRTPYHGLLFGFNATTLAQEALFNATPTGGEGGIWMSGAAPSADEQGNIYVSVGNGSFNGTTNFGQSIVKLNANLQELDFFTPYNWSAQNNVDLDLGSGNVIVVPLQTGPFPHELIACGKPTPIYLINRDAMGHVGTTSDHIVQEVDHQLGATGSFRDSGQPCYNSASMWNQNVYFVSNHDVMKKFTLDPNTGLLSTTPASKGAFTYGWPGAVPAVSSNGDDNGIVWTIDTATSTLRANDANDVSKVLYVSAAFGTAIRWVVPTVINGHVYIGLQGKILSYSVH